MSEQLPDWVSSSALTVFWQRVQARFEANGLVATGRTVVDLPTRDERHAVGGLLGRPQVRDRVSIDLAELDDRLRMRSNVGGLADVLPLVTGSDLRDRPADRAARADARARPLALAAGLLREAWADDWVAGLRSTGLLTGRNDAEELVRDAVRVLEHLVGAAPEPAQSRVEVAARLTGDAHALDLDRPLHQLVLRGLAAAAGRGLPATADERRALWAAYGVTPDRISRSCLVLGLRTTGSHPTSARLRLAADSGDPVHVTDWDLGRIDGSWHAAGTVTPVLICENPRVLEAVAERHGGRHPVVCTAGEPNTVVVELLERLAAEGRTLRYHGDFDWPGLSIANRVMARFGAQPWLLSSFDYEQFARPDGPSLTGAPVDAGWDAELRPVMQAFGRALHEESVLPHLLEELGP